jgi:D-alanyl-D-alanine carboxypeptidase
MKKWIFVLAALTVIVVAGQFLQEEESSISNRNNTELMENDSTYQFIAIDSEHVHKGKLLLINADHQLTELATDLVIIEASAATSAGFALEKEDIKLSEEVLQALQQMLLAAKEDGVGGFLITSGYRSMEQQEKLYEQQGSDYALPAGYSEHNSGLAVDISSLTMKMEFAAEGEWLREHAAQYGFVLRYPPNKQHITGIQYEPWHFRYIGLPHSKVMMEKDWVLEEYVEYLAANPHTKVAQNRIEYHIDYYDVAVDSFIKLPVHSNYYISGDNVSGLIVTSWRGE